MGSADQLAILKQGVDVWNEWRENNPRVEVEFIEADLTKLELIGADLSGTNLVGVDLSGSDFRAANFQGADLTAADLIATDLEEANLMGATLVGANLVRTKLRGANLKGANLAAANLSEADLFGAQLMETQFSLAKIGATLFRSVDLKEAIGLDMLDHLAPSDITISTLSLSAGRIAGVFLRGCGLSDWEVEQVKLYQPDLSNEEVNVVLYKIYELRATQALQISPLFISYSHEDSEFVGKIGDWLTEKGIRYWRDIHEMKAGRIEAQIDRGIRQNPTVLLVLSGHSLNSDWVEHEVRTARVLEKEMGRDVLCPVALDDSWMASRWPKRLMEQIMEYNILDFSEWKDDSKFESMFRRLVDGLELFYKA